MTAFLSLRGLRLWRRTWQSIFKLTVDNNSSTFTGMASELEMGVTLADIGADSTKEPIPQQYYLPFQPLDKELQQAISWIGFRRGNSPRVASFKITSLCNLGCFHCDAHKPSGKSLSTEGTYRVLECLGEAGIQNVDLTGGEPTRRKDLLKIIAYSSKLGLHTTLNSNGGIEQDESEELKYWRDLANAGLAGATFSYDGMPPKNNPRVIELAQYTLMTLHRYAGIRTVVTMDNLDKVYNIGKMCMLNSIFFQPVPAVALGGESSASADNFHPLDEAGWKEFVDINHRLRKVRGPFARYLRMPEAFLKEVASAPNPETAFHCKNPSAHWISVDEKGNARVCNDVPLSRTYSLTGKTNPLLTKQFHQDVNEASKECPGCDWLCHWEGNRANIRRVVSEARDFITAASMT